jgi:AcrR family transcriptional regulator
MLPNHEKIDPRVRRTRQSIEQAFVELVRERGFQAISVQDIAGRAGINRATFYAHFPDKFDLLNQFTRDSFQKEVDQRMFNACHFSMDNLRELIVVVCEFVGETHDHCAVSEQQFQSMVANQVRTQITGLLDHWLETAALIEDARIPPGLAAIAASWAIYGLATEWSRAKRTPPVEQYADLVLPLVATNLGLTVHA